MTHLNKCGWLHSNMLKIKFLNCWELLRALLL
uniref:Uncharacterized protein n=1 Tax=Siphoviridae sp. ctZHD14 TaxID=2827891 RepID=A0A8S5SWZ7_9CAUD|nr:MAG TPA: hypothetical protein [Siphoviridae sp. ctZHD14]